MDSVKVIFQDDELLALDKPPYLVTDKSETTKDETLVDILQKQFQINLDRGGLVHRLDKDTSGVIIVAKTQSTLENLQAQFKERKTKKEYLALVHGLVEKRGVVEGAIGRNPVKREKFMVMEGSESIPPERWKEAVTEYEPLEGLQFTDSGLQEVFSSFNKIQMRKLSTAHYNLFTLLRCFPQTGRTHQIRVHLKHILRPIVSDEVYGGKKVVRLDKRWCPRQFLHAAKLGFYQPKSGEWMEIESPLAEDLKQVLKLLK